MFASRSSTKTQFRRSLLSWKYHLPGLPHVRPPLSTPFSTARCDSSGPSGVEYEWIDGVEPLELYEPGGYHPTMVGDLLGASTPARSGSESRGRYIVVDKLGHGGYSTVWLAYDQFDKNLVALKVGIASSDLPRREAKILRKLSSPPGATRPQTLSLLPRILDEFEIKGPNGTHTCISTMPRFEDSFLQPPVSYPSGLCPICSFGFSRGSCAFEGLRSWGYSTSQCAHRTAIEVPPTDNRAVQKRVWRARIRRHYSYRWQASLAKRTAKSNTPTSSREVGSRIFVS
jgi:hypothetical protein